MNTLAPEIQADFDRNADVLYLSVGQPRPAEGEFVGDLILRYAMEDDEPCGVTVLGFKKRHHENRLSDLAKKVADHLHGNRAEIERAIRMAIR